MDSCLRNTAGDRLFSCHSNLAQFSSGVMEENRCISYCNSKGRLFGLYLRQFITDDNYFPYFHLIIAILSQAAIFLALWHDGQQPPAFLTSCPVTISHYYPLLDQLRVASVAIASMLVFDLLLDLYSLKVIYPRSNNELLKQNSGARWKEFTIRCMFIVSFIEQNLIMISTPKDEYSAVVSIATSHVQNIMIFAMGLFIMSYAFNLAPCQRFRSILLSLIFCAGQVMSFFATMDVCPINWTTNFMIVRIGLDILPPVVFLATSASLVKSLILRMRAAAANKNTLNGKEMVFVVNFLAAAVWYILKFTILASQQQLYMPQLTASNLVIFDLSVMFFALLATIIRAWLARLESTTAHVSQEHQLTKHFTVDFCNFL